MALAVRPLPDRGGAAPWPGRAREAPRPDTGTERVDKKEKPSAEDPETGERNPVMIG